MIGAEDKKKINIFYDYYLLSVIKKRICDFACPRMNCVRYQHQFDLMSVHNFGRHNVSSVSIKVMIKFQLFPMMCRQLKQFNAYFDYVSRHNAYITYNICTYPFFCRWNFFYFHLFHSLVNEAKAI